MEIVLAIGGVIAGLLILWAVLAVIIAAIARRAVIKFNKEAEAEHEARRKRHGIF